MWHLMQRLALNIVVRNSKNKARATGLPEQKSAGRFPTARNQELYLKLLRNFRRNFLAFIVF